MLEDGGGLRFGGGGVVLEDGGGLRFRGGGGDDGGGDESE